MFQKLILVGEVCNRTIGDVYEGNGIWIDVILVQRRVDFTEYETCLV